MTNQNLQDTNQESNLVPIPRILPQVETDDTVIGQANDPAIWVNPNNPGASLILGTLENGGLAIFNLQGELQQLISSNQVNSSELVTENDNGTESRFNSVDIIYNFPLPSMLAGAETKTDLAIVSDAANDSVTIFTIAENGELTKLATPTLDNAAFSIFGVDDGKATAYGLAAYTSPDTGKSYVFVSQAHGNRVAQLELTAKLGPADELLLDAQLVRTLELPIPDGGTPADSQAEGLVVDQELGFVYIAIEDSNNILKFAAEPNGGNEFNTVPIAPPRPQVFVPFSEFVAFGDSTTDVGNIFLSTEGQLPPSPPYFEGRFSNGPLVPELIAQSLGLSASIPSLAGGKNYAFAGAEISPTEEGDEPSVGDQIQLYLAENTPTETDLFFISAGGNDIVPNLNVGAAEIVTNIPNVEDVVDSLTGHITTLANAGAENFIVSNAAGLDLSPLISVNGVNAQVGNAIAAYNQLLDVELDELEAELGVNIYELDVKSEFDNLLANADELGFTNTTDPALNALQENLPIDPSTFVWWDAVHPTGTTYNILANALIDDIPKDVTEFIYDTRTPLAPDIKGLSIYYGEDGKGYLIAASQGNSSYVVLDREAENEYIGSFKIGESGDIDGVNQSEGIDVINVGLGSEFPNGLLVVQDKDNQSSPNDNLEVENADTNFKFIDWEKIAQGFPTPLDIDTTSYNPRQQDSGTLDQPSLQVNPDNIFTIDATPSTLTNLKATLKGANADKVNQFGFFIVNDDVGTITDSNGNNLTPDNPDYIATGMLRSQTIFSAISNKPQGYQDTSSSGILPDLAGGTKIVFFLIPNGSINDVINGKIDPSQVILGRDSLQVNQLQSDKFELTWSGNGNNSNFENLTLDLELTDELPPLGSTELQTEQAELIDLRDISGSVNATFSLYREAAFNNQLAFYQVDDPITGAVNGVTPDDNAAYLAAILNSDKLIDVGDLKVSNQGFVEVTAEIAGGGVIAPLIAINGSLEQLQDENTNNDPRVYFAYMGANNDNIDHIRLLGDNTFGFEDLPGGGDLDYQDLIVKVDITPV